MFWEWFLKYSSFLVTGVVSLCVGYILHKLTTGKADLICYTSQPAYVVIPPQPGQPPNPPLGTFTLFLFNQGKAPAKEVHIGHIRLPPHNIYPDIPSEEVRTPAGGTAIRFAVIPPGVMILI